MSVVIEMIKCGYVALPLPFSGSANWFPVIYFSRSRYSSRSLLARQRGWTDQIKIDTTISVVIKMIMMNVVIKMTKMSVVIKMTKMSVTIKMIKCGYQDDNDECGYQDDKDECGYQDD